MYKVIKEQYMAKKAKAEASESKTKTAATSSAQSQAKPAKPAAMRAPVGAFLAEVIGTFMLAAVVIAVSGQQLFVMFALIAIVLVVGNLSGAHLNPAITFGAWLTRQISGIRAIGYVIAQFVGAMLAVVALNALLGGTPEQQGFMGQAAAEPSLFKASPLVEGKEWYAFFAEVLGAGLFGFAVAAAFKHKEQMAAAFTVGGGLFIGLLVGGMTAVLNPAIALAIDALKFDGIMPTVVYALATLIGAGLGFLAYKVLRKEVDSEAKA